MKCARIKHGLSHVKKMWQNNFISITLVQKFSFKTLYAFIMFTAFFTRFSRNLTHFLYNFHLQLPMAITFLHFIHVGPKIAGGTIFKTGVNKTKFCANGSTLIFCKSHLLKVCWNETVKLIKTKNKLVGSETLSEVEKHVRHCFPQLPFTRQTFRLIHRAI